MRPQAPRKESAKGIVLSFLQLQPSSCDSIISIFPIPWHSDPDAMKQNWMITIQIFPAIKRLFAFAQTMRHDTGSRTGSSKLRPLSVERLSQEPSHLSRSAADGHTMLLPELLPDPLVASANIAHPVHSNANLGNQVNKRMPDAAAGRLASCHPAESHWWLGLYLFPVITAPDQLRFSPWTGVILPVAGKGDEQFAWTVFCDSWPGQIITWVFQDGAAVKNDRRMLTLFCLLPGVRCSFCHCKFPFADSKW